MNRRIISSFYQRVMSILNGNLKTINGNSIVGTGNVTIGGTANWGSIGGTLSSQTDLQTALNNKQDTLVSGTNIKTIEGQSLLGSGNIDLTKNDVGLGNVDDTSDLNKPISTATQTALNNKQDTLTLTTIGTSGASTLIGSTLNIPQYSGGGGGGSVSTIEMGFTGTIVTGTTTNTITKTILLPANTFAINNGIEIIASFGINGTTGGVNARLYLNTTPSLTGATLVNTFYSVAGGSVMNNHMNYRFFMFDGTNMRTFFAQNTGVVSNIFQSVAAAMNVSYNLSTAYYLIFAIQNGNVANSSVINGYRVLKYA